MSIWHVFRIFLSAFYLTTFLLGVISLWVCSAPFVPVSIVEGHEEGAVTDFVFVTDNPEDRSSTILKLDRRSTEPVGVSPMRQFESPSQQRGSRRHSDMLDTSDTQKEPTPKAMILSVGRDGQCLLQDFSRGKAVMRKFEVNITDFDDSCDI